MCRILFEDLMTASELPEVVFDHLEVLAEHLTYDQLFRMSEPKRFQRSLTVKMPPLEMQQYQTGNHWVFEYFFNAKGNPSTTGLRHKGYVRFKKPKRSQAGKNTPLSKLAVEVDCMCPDYRYRWAWANHQRSAGPIGPNSLNQCINRAPRKTNPSGAPGLCKHILATRDYIYGLLSGFPTNLPFSDKLDKLTKRATRRWLNFDQDMEKARERDAKIAAAKARRNVGLPPDQQNKPIAAIPAQEAPPLPEPIVPEVPMPPAPATEKPVEKPAAPAGKAKKPVEPKGAFPQDFLTKRFMKVESVSITTNMKTLNAQEIRVLENARKIVEEMEDDLGEPLGAPGMDGAGGPDELPPPGGADMPVEPPVSDSAVGASTEDNVALALLREIRDLLANLAAEEAAEGSESPELPEEGAEPEEGPHDGMEGASEDEDEAFKPGKRPMPVTTGAE